MKTSNEDSPPVRLSKEFLQAGNEWLEAKLKLDQAKLEYDYAIRRLVLKKRELRHMQGLWDYLEWEGELQAEFGDTDDFHGRLLSFDLVGEPIGSAARGVLRRVSNATVEELADELARRGFQFSTDSPARELHGALVKQPWATRDADTKEWKYVRTG